MVLCILLRLTLFIVLLFRMQIEVIDKGLTISLLTNAAGLDEEAQMSFEEHVFLEDQIKDFPERGPIRHFMELVLVGLSKNPHISVQRKHEHIEWFRQYFRAKADVLRASGALPEDGEFFYLGQDEQRSSIEASWTAIVEGRDINARVRMPIAVHMHGMQDYHDNCAE